MQAQDSGVAGDPGTGASDADMAAARDREAQLLRDQLDKATKPAGRKDPPTWGVLAAKATAQGLKLVGPIRPGHTIVSASIEKNGAKITGCQAMDWDGTLPDRADRLLRAQLGAALWALEGG